MNHVDRKPGVRLVTDRLQADRIGAPKPAAKSPIDQVIEEAEAATRDAAKRE